LEESSISRRKRNDNRYKKLLKDKLITQEEYEILLNYNNQHEGVEINLNKNE